MRLWPDIEASMPIAPCYDRSTRPFGYAVCANVQVIARPLTLFAAVWSRSFLRLGGVEEQRRQRLVGEVRVVRGYGEVRRRLGWSEGKRKRIRNVTCLLLRRRVGRMPLYLGSSSKSGRERIRVATSACRRRGCLESIKGGDRDTSERPRRGCGVGADSGKRVLGRRRGRGDNHGGTGKNSVESLVYRLHCRTRDRARRARRRRRRKDEVTEAGGAGQRQGDRRKG